MSKAMTVKDAELRLEQMKNGNNTGLIHVHAGIPILVLKYFLQKKNNSNLVKVENIRG